MDTEKSILIAFILNLVFSVFEFAGGIFTNSIAIISDSIHDMGDAISIGISYFLEKKSKNPPDEKDTYGYARYSVIGSTSTTTILILGSVLVIYNAVKRLITPSPVNYNGMIVFAVFGVIVNSLAVFITHDGHSLNQKAVSLHMLEDVLGWIVVLIGSVLMHFTDIAIIDPIMSIIVAVIIFINAVKNLKESVYLFLEKAPSDINTSDIINSLSDIEGIIDIHHIHIWSLNNDNNCASLHVVTNHDTFEIKEKIRYKLSEHNINHITIETEKVNEACTNIDCNINTSHHHSKHHHCH